MPGGLFITFEGGEGSGKTTQIALLKKRIEALGFPVIVTREPGGTRLGSELRRHLVAEGEDPPCPRAELLLYAADRAHHVEKVINPALSLGKVVLCDRYADATLAYQGFGRGLDRELIGELNGVATGGLVPHRTVWLDLDPFEGVRRSLERQSNEGVVAESRFEHEEAAFHARVRGGYGEIARSEPARFRLVDGAGEVADIAERIWAAVEDLFEPRGAP